MIYTVWWSDWGIYTETTLTPLAPNNNRLEMDFFLLSLYPPIGSPAVKAKVIHLESGREEDLEHVREVSKTPDPWSWYWSFKNPAVTILPGDKLELTVSYNNTEVNSQVEMPIIIYTNVQRDSASVEKKGPETLHIPEEKAPRLIRSLNSAVVRKSPPQGAPDAATVRQILRHIWHRLRRPMVENAWLGKDGNGYGSRFFHLTYKEESEELWARRLSEMMTFAVYSGIKEGYGGSVELSEFYDRMKFGRELGDPAFSLVLACQDLATMAVVTRGFDANLNAGWDSSVTVQKDMDGLWLLGRDEPKTVMEQADLQPGSFFLFCLNEPPGDKNQTGDHIAPILRVLNTESKKYIQFFDTGSLEKIRDKEADRPFIVPNSPDQYEDPWWKDRVKGINYGFFGCGVAPAKSSEDLKKGFQLMEEAVPLGMARLVLLDNTAPLDADPSKPDYVHPIIYATPLLDMHTGTMYPEFKPFQNFSIARYLWSLRELPGRDAITAVWLIDIPQRSLAREYMDEGALRTTSLVQLADRLANKFKSSLPHEVLWEPQNKNDGFQFRRPLIDVRNMDDGKVEVWRFFPFKKGKKSPIYRPNPVLPLLPFDKHTRRFTFDKEGDTLASFLTETYTDFIGESQTLFYFKGCFPFDEVNVGR